MLLPAVGWPRPATGGCHSVNQRKTPGRRPGVFRARADLIAPVFSRVAPDANEAPVGQSLGQSLACPWIEELCRVAVPRGLWGHQHFDCFLVQGYL